MNTKNETTKAPLVLTKHFWTAGSSNIKQIAQALAISGSPKEQYAAACRLGNLANQIKAYTKNAAYEQTENKEDVLNGVFSFVGGGDKFGPDAFDFFDPWLLLSAKIETLSLQIKAHKEQQEEIEGLMKTAYNSKGAEIFLSDEFGEFAGMQVEPARPKTVKATMKYNINK